MPETRKPPRVGDPKVDFLLSVNRLLAAAEDARRCRDELLDESDPQTVLARGSQEVTQ